MNIDRQNYESFFLQYADGELSASEQDAVQQFVALHPDLQQELNEILQAVLRPESVPFLNKAQLFRISEATEENLLSLLDNEVSAPLRQEIEQQIAAEPAVAQAWQHLQKTKLDPAESVLHPDKSTLYRTAPAKTIPLRRWWMAAAAAIAGLATWGIVHLATTEQSGRAVAAMSIPANPPSGANSITPGNTGEGHQHTVAVPPRKTVIDQSVINNSPDNNPASSVNTIVASTVASKKRISQNVSLTSKQASRRTHINTDRTTNTQTLAVANNNQRDPLLENFNSNSSNKNNSNDVTLSETGNNNQPGSVDVATVLPPASTSATLIGSSATTAPVATVSPRTTTEFRQPAEYDDENTDRANQKNTLFRGILRTFRRVLARNTNSDREGIKVANFVIASR
jgi:anti-sigma factor RsiW